MYAFFQYDKLYQFPRIKINLSELYSEASGMEAVLGWTESPNIYIEAPIKSSFECDFIGK